MHYAALAIYLKVMNKKIGVVLSGGGAKGVAHIGFLQALNEFGIKPEYISGCSSGAIVACLYAAGCNTKQMLDFFFTNANIFSLYKVSARKAGIFDSEKYVSTLDPLIINDSFEELKYKLIVNATDILKGEPVYFSEGGDLKRKVIASAAVPGIFTPVEIDGSIFIDGATMDNFPVQPLLGKDLTIFGSFISMHNVVSLREMSNTLRLANRAGQLAFNSGSLRQLQFCDHLIAPKSLNKYSIFDTKKLNKIYETGYKETYEYLSKMNLK
jgi:NTE family protein